MMRSSAMAAGAATVAMVDMSEVDSAWEAFTAQLQQHESHLEEQKSQLQGQVSRQVSTAIAVCCAAVSVTVNWPPEKQMCHLHGQVCAR